MGKLASTYPCLVLRRKRERSLLFRHPWLFSGGIARVEGSPEEGDIVQVVSHEGKLMAYGFYSERSQITARLFEFTDSPMEFDMGYWYQKLEKAKALRERLLAGTSTNGYRLVHGEGDGLPGLVVDVYGDMVSVQMRNKGIQRLAPTILSFLSSSYSHVYSKRSLRAGGSTGEWLKGGIDTVQFQENGLRFAVDPVRGQKTGFFLDQRDNRALVGRFSNGRKVLNMFSYTGGFSVYALAGGAKEVVSVDSSKSAMALCDQNIGLNAVDKTLHSSMPVDCFQYLKQMNQGHFDLIVLDPPAFSKSPSTVKNASRGYKDLNLRAMRKIARGGLLFTYSCSQHISRDLFRKIVFGAALDAGRHIRIIAQMTQGLDHPIDICHPEGEYLKGLALYVD